MAPGVADVPFWEGLGPGLVILDGGLATELERHGADLRDPLWSAKLLLEDPGLIRQVHEAYVAAGADVVTTATYQLSFEGFARRGLDRAQTVAAVRLSVRLAREAGPKVVAASVGPYGAFLADGFYEWQRRDGRKQPYLIGVGDHEPFAFAGLWE